VRDALTRTFADRHGAVAPTALSDGEWSEVRRLAEDKYRSWDWTVGRSPAFTIRRTADWSGGRWEASIRVHRGVIVHVALVRPDARPPGLSGMGAALEGCRYHPAAVGPAIQTSRLSAATGVSVGRLVDWLCPSPDGWLA
jgi:lipoate-protein ligase A